MKVEDVLSIALDMQKKRYFILVLSLLAVTMLFSGCKKKDNNPYDCTHLQELWSSESGSFLYQFFEPCQRSR